MNPRRVLGVAVVVLLLGSAPFAVGVSTEEGESEAVPFDRTKTVGLPQSVVRQAQQTGVVVPRAEVFYSQYRYVVGYYGITPLLADLATGRTRALGRPLTVHVSDFSRTNVSVSDEGHLWIPETSPLTPGWVPADEAYFVVGSRARVPTRGTAVVPFSIRADAAAFAEQYGGEVRDWSSVQRLSVGGNTRSRAAWERVVRQRHQRADATATARRDLLDRPVSVVVGEDAPTVAGAVARAPPNTTVLVPPGRYEVADLRIRKPLTLRGAGPNATRLVGDREGSVVRVPAPRTALADLAIAGVGPNRSGVDAPPEDVRATRNDSLFDMRRVHGYGDAAVVFATAGRSLVSNVTINTTSNGVVVRDSPNVTVSNLTVYGTKRWEDGFLGVSAIGARVVVQDSRFLGGKVGVFALDASGSVVRDSSMEGMMVGSFGLFTRRLLVADNDVEDTGYGVYVETRSYDTAVVGNDVRHSANGLIVAGSSNYVAGNVLAKNERGVVVEGHYTTYARNVLGYNDVALRALGLLPTNRVTGNDVAGNARPAAVSAHNVLHVWRGNYWASAPGVRRTPTGHLRRAFHPAGPVDGAVDRVRYAPVVAHSPALGFVRQLQRLVPGLEVSAVVDPAPLARPVRPDAVAGLRARYDRPGPSEDDDPWDYRP